MYSPDGVTVSAQIKPKTPGRDKRGKPKRYETPGKRYSGLGNILDVHPSMLEAVRDPSRDLWITEGVKKADGAASRGRCCIALAGVEGWVNKGGVPVPCWEHVPLSGRRVFVAYDSDVMVKASVQGALGRLVDFLEGRGAEPRMVYLPHREDGKTGLDDYLACGGNLAELEVGARPFDRTALAAERLERTPRLVEALENLRRRLREMPVKTTGENTRAAAVRALSAEAERSGELVRDGVRVIMDRRTLAERAQKSKKAINKAIAYLEAEDPPTLRVDNVGRRAEKAGAFVLLTPIAQKGTHNGGREAARGKSGKGKEGRLEPFIGPSDHGGYPSALEDVPALRWSKVILYWAREDGIYKVVDHHYVPRLGEKRGAIIRHVLEAGGAATLEALMERFASARARPWDFRRRVLGPIVEAGILSATAEGVALTDDWREALRRERVRAGEIEDAERQREKHARQRQGFRRRHEHRADPTPELRGPEAVQEMLASRRLEWERQRIEREREKVGTTAAAFVADTLDGITAVRYHELRQRWTAMGGKGEDLRRAATRSPFRLTREADGWLYVYPASVPAASLEREPATVAVLHEAPSNRPTDGRLDGTPPVVVEPRPPEPKVEPSRRREESSTGLAFSHHDNDTPPGFGGEASEAPADDWRDHPLDCECPRCTSAIASYATPWRAS
jgi:hypothetical protein